MFNKQIKALFQLNHFSMNCAEPFEKCMTCFENSLKCDECYTYEMVVVNGVCISKLACEDDPNCGKCNEQNPQICDICSNGEPPNSEVCEIKACVDQYCKFCQISTICTSCISGYTALDGECISNNQCIINDNNCLSCDSRNPKLCSLCKDRKSPETDQKCAKQPEKCDIPNCSKCVDENNFLCDTCNKGFAIGYEEIKCIEFTPTNECNVQNCKTCVLDNPQQCDTCINIFFYSEGKCIPDYDINETTCFSPNCFKCDIKNKYFCDKCKDNYEKINGICFNFDQCKQQDVNCKTCNKENAFQCEVCKYGDKEADKPCPAQICNIANCDTCEVGKPEICEICETFYEFANGKCVPGNCEKISEQICEVCKGKFFKNNEQLCSPCRANCLSCSSAGQCQKCDRGFEVIENKCEKVKSNMGVIIGVSVGVVVVIIVVVVIVVIILKKKKATGTTNQRVAALN